MQYLTPSEVEQYLKRYYENPADMGHGRAHIEAVRRRTRELVAEQGYEKPHLADLAAVLHDIGLKTDRKTHETVGARMVRDDSLLSERLSEEDHLSLVDAIANHRASTGNPRSMLARILSDADRTGEVHAKGHLNRAYNYGKVHRSQLSDEDNLRECVAHLVGKYGKDGYAHRSLQFDSSRDIVAKSVAPLEAALRSGDILSLRDMLE